MGKRKKTEAEMTAILESGPGVSMALQQRLVKLLRNGGLSSGQIYDLFTSDTGKVSEIWISAVAEILGSLGIFDKRGVSDASNEDDDTPQTWEVILGDTLPQKKVECRVVTLPPGVTERKEFGQVLADVSGLEGPYWRLATREVLDAFFAQRKDTLPAGCVIAIGGGRIADGQYPCIYPGVIGPDPFLTYRSTRDLEELLIEFRFLIYRELDEPVTYPVQIGEETVELGIVYGEGGLFQDTTGAAIEVDGHPAFDVHLAAFFAQRGQWWSLISRDLPLLATGTVVEEGQTALSPAITSKGDRLTFDWIATPFEAYFLYIVNEKEEDAPEELSLTEWRQVLLSEDAYHVSVRLLRIHPSTPWPEMQEILRLEDVVPVPYEWLTIIEREQPKLYTAAQVGHQGVLVTQLVCL